MTALALLFGMLTIINVTMLAAVVQLAGNIPDRSLLLILTRYLKKNREPEGADLHPWEAASRLARLRRRMLATCTALALLGAALSIWALAAGWGTVAILAIASWVIAGNLLLDSTAPAIWRRRLLRMDSGDDGGGGAAGESTNSG